MTLIKVESSQPLAVKRIPSACGGEKGSGTFSPLLLATRRSSLRPIGRVKAPMIVVAALCDLPPRPLMIDFRCPFDRVQISLPNFGIVWRDSKLKCGVLTWFAAVSMVTFATAARVEISDSSL